MRWQETSAAMPLPTDINLHLCNQACRKSWCAPCTRMVARYWWPRSLALCGREQCGILSNEIIDQRKDILDKALSERYREGRELIWAFFLFWWTKCTTLYVTGSTGYVSHPTDLLIYIHVHALELSVHQVLYSLNCQYNKCSMDYDINSESAHAPFDITMQWSDINLKTKGNNQPTLSIYP